MKFLHKDWGERSNRKGREDADENEERLVYDHCCFPSCTPIL